MGSALQGLRTGLRSLVRTPAFSGAAVLVLGLSLGAAAALFGVVNALFVRPLPYPAEERLVAVFETLSPRRPVRLLVSLPALEALKAQPDLEEVSAVARGAGSLDVGDLATPVQVNRATAPLFSLLGVRPQLGRGFRADDEQPGAPRVTVLSFELWWRRYGGDPGLLGRPITLDGEPHTVIGVLPPAFLPQLPAEVWTPAVFTPAQLSEERRRYGLVLVLARLRAGVSIAALQERISALSAKAREESPDARTLQLVPLRDAFAGQLGPVLGVLLAAVGLLLLIACANVANLMLVRAAARQKELAIRLALGASRARLIVQLLLEGLLLGGGGAALGLLLAMWAIELLAPSGSEAVRTAGIEVDARVLLATLGAGLLCGLVAASAPALQATRPDLTESLKTGLRRAPTAARRRVRNGLVAAEVALALVLLFGAAQAARALRQVMATDPGFDPRGVLALRLQLPPGRYPDGARQAAFLRALTERAARLPGVAGSGFVGSLPLRAAPLWDFDVEGPGGRGRGHVIEFIQVAAPGTVEALRVALLAGRAFERGDGEGAPRVALVNLAMARRYWPGEDALGKRLRPWRFHYEDAFGKRFWPHAAAHGAGSVYSTHTADTSQSADSADTAGTARPADTADEADGAGGTDWFTVVGVLGDVRQVKLQLPARPEVWLPSGQFPLPEGTLLLRQREEQARRRPDPAVVSEVKAAVADLDPELAISEVAPLEELVSASASQERDAVVLLGLFAGLALLMAGIGVYGVMVSVATERQREIAIRLSLGARRRSVVRLLLRQALGLSLVGVLLGVLASPLVTVQVSALVLRPLRFEPWLCAGAALALLLTALLASVLPARRAARTDPGISLRHE